MGVEAMTPKQRFLAALNGRRGPALCSEITSVVNFELMDIVGSHFPEAKRIQSRWLNWLQVPTM
ncbi:MAG: hypothetical protein Ct9H300mP14_06580 [Gammaproteobacteria bacterium]|nr:MAG: hypothetical protein Ct9H300mP14_06580 [Gammaproteobacteria bacterium]